jgi:hypothetical protein
VSAVAHLLVDGFEVELVGFETFEDVGEVVQVVGLFHQGGVLLQCVCFLQQFHQSFDGPVGLVEF